MAGPWPSVMCLFVVVHLVHEHAQEKRCHQEHEHNNAQAHEAVVGGKQIDQHFHGFLLLWFRRLTVRPSGVAFNDEDQVLVINTCFNSCCSLLHDPRVEFTMPSLSQGELSFPARLFLISGAVSACISVLLSAALAHLPVFSAGMPAMVQTALTQQQFHSLGLVGVGLSIVRLGASRWLISSGWLMLAGLFLFSFNLYARYVFGIDTFRVAVPWGGGAWILAWLLAAVGFARR